MPTNRTIIDRARRATITPEALALFIELEQTPARQRGGQDFQDKAHQLMRWLDLVSEFWTMNSVLDRSRGPCHPEGYIARDDWFRCRAVREALLEAAKVRQ
jgi:hypothetical protein